MVRAAGSSEIGWLPALALLISHGEQISLVAAGDDGIQSAPPMGWSTWWENLRSHSWQPMGFVAQYEQ